MNVNQEDKKKWIAMRDLCEKLLKPFSKSERMFVKYALSNWDNTSNEELVEEFVKQSSIPIETAQEIVKCRPYFELYNMADIMDNGYFDEDFA